MTDEIMVIDEFFSASECESAIQEMDMLIDAGFAHKYGPLQSPSDQERKDTQLFLHDHDHVARGDGCRFWQTFLERYENAALPAYADRFPILKNKRIANLQCKLQKTAPSGGFHKWHYENFDLMHCDRLVTWSLFLNDGFEGGETEFLYYKKRCEPRTGRLVLFPAHWGATHRGNPPLNGDKYLATGWTVDMDHYLQ